MSIGSRTTTMPLPPKVELPSQHLGELVGRAERWLSLGMVHEQVKWTALPLFSPIATADDPVGLIINDTATLKVCRRHRTPAHGSGAAYDASALLAHRGQGQGT